MTAATHPLFGQLLHATGFKRWEGDLFLLVSLPDGTPGTIPADATDILGAQPTEPTNAVLSAEGLRKLHQLVGTLGPPKQRRSTGNQRK